MCVFICIYICTYRYMYICTYIHIYIVTTLYNSLENRSPIPIVMSGQTQQTRVSRRHTCQEYDPCWCPCTVDISNHTHSLENRSSIPIVTSGQTHQTRVVNQSSCKESEEIGRGREQSILHLTSLAPRSVCGMHSLPHSQQVCTMAASSTPQPAGERSHTVRQRTTLRSREPSAACDPGCAVLHRAADQPARPPAGPFTRRPAHPLESRLDLFDPPPPSPSVSAASYPALLDPRRRRATRAAGSGPHSAHWEQSQHSADRRSTLR